MYFSHTFRLAVCVLALLVPIVGWSARYVVESAPYAQREQAETHLKRVLVETGDVRCRVVRRYVRGAGWRYLVAMEGLEAEQAALEVLPLFSGDQGAGTVWELDGEGRTAVNRSAPPSPSESTPSAPAVQTNTDGAGEPAPALPEPAASEAPSEPGASERRVIRRQERGAEELLAEASIAHGGPTGGRAAVSSSGRVLFRFKRVMPREGAELVAVHRFSRDGEGMAVTIQVESGDGVDSRIVHQADGKAWVWRDGETLARDAARTRDVLRRFSPESLMSIPLGFADDLAKASAWRGLRLIQRDGQGFVLVHPGGSGATGPDGLIQATFDRHRHLVEVLWRDGGSITRMAYGRYKTFHEGVVLPQQVEVSIDGRVVERVQVLELDFTPELPATEFTEPSQLNVSERP